MSTCPGGLARLNGFVRLIRPVNCLMVGLAVVVAGLIASRGALEPSLSPPLALGFITGFTLCGAAMSINDYYDREVDVINDPSRPIPSGLVRPVEALALAIALAAIGVLSSALINPLCLAIAVIAFAVSVYYATAGKSLGLPGNAMVSLCVALPFIYGGAIMGGLDLTLALFAAMAFLANMGREVTKGIVDVVGDAARGVRTVAAVHGRVAAAKLAAAMYLSAVALSLAPWLMGLVGPYYLPIVLMSDIGFIATSMRLLRGPTREGARRAKREALAWMLIGLAAFTAGTLAP